MTRHRLRCVPESGESIGPHSTRLPRIWANSAKASSESAKHDRIRRSSARVKLGLPGEAERQSPWNADCATRHVGTDDGRRTTDHRRPTETQRPTGWLGRSGAVEGALVNRWLERDREAAVASYDVEGTSVGSTKGGGGGGGRCCHRLANQRRDRVRMISSWTTPDPNTNQAPRRLKPRVRGSPHPRPSTNGEAHSARTRTPRSDRAPRRGQSLTGR